MSTPEERAPVWKLGFAVVVALIAAALTWWLLGSTRILEPDLGLDADQYGLFDGRQVLHARVVGVVATVGIFVVAVGLWMAAVEWRGRFAAARESPSVEPYLFSDGTARIVAALGALRGAALVLVSGVVILLGVSWMTASASGAPPATTATTVPPASSGSSGN